MCTRNAAVAILSAIAIISLPEEASAQTLLERFRSWLHIERSQNIEIPQFETLEPITYNVTELTLMAPPPEVVIEDEPPVVNEAVFDLQSTSDSHDWTSINDWLLSGLPTGVPAVDPSLNLQALNVDRDQFLCLATNIYFEARGSTLDDQRAVALVTLNRTRHWRWRGAVCDVVWERYQFSWTINANQPRNRVRTVGSWQAAQLVAYEVLRGFIPDITRGATNYYNPSVVQPTWANLAVESQRIGAHRYLTLRTTRDYNPPANLVSAPSQDRSYSGAIRAILRQMRMIG